MNSSLSKKLPISVNDLSELVEQIQKIASKQSRVMVAVCGAPATGKSTLADELGKLINASVVPMDGFHLDDAVLIEMNLLGRKGSPQTFDVDGLSAVLSNLQKGERDVFVPTFDRETETTRGAARRIAVSDQIILVEGNYLCLDLPVWRDIAKHFDITVYLEEPEEVLHQRLVERWQSYGFDKQMISQKVDHNDMLNVKTVINNCLVTDFKYSRSTELDT